MRYNNELQILRAYAIIAVLLGHMSIMLPDFLMHGYSAVSLFFVLSGYLAAVNFQYKYDGKEVKNYLIVKNEFISKVFRLVPSMWIWILIYFFIGSYINFLGGSYGDTARWFVEIKHVLTGTYNYYLAGLPIGGLIGQYWSLFVEIHFYILFTMLFIFLKKRSQRIILSSAIIFLTTFLFRPLTEAGLIRYCTHTQLDALFAGVVLGLTVHGKKEKIVIPAYAKKLIMYGLLILLFILPYFLDNSWHPNFKYPLYTLISALIVLGGGSNSGWVWNGDSRGKIKKLLVDIGNKSFSIYKERKQ